LALASSRSLFERGDCHVTCDTRCGEPFDVADASGEALRRVLVPVPPPRFKAGFDCSSQKMFIFCFEVSCTVRRIEAFRCRRSENAGRV
jgi:hypothetical protein